MFKANSLDTDQMPHLWHLICVYTALPTCFYGSPCINRLSWNIKRNIFDIEAENRRGVPDI